MEKIGNITLPLVDANPETNPRLRLLSVHEVEDGEIMVKIAEEHGVSLEHLLEFNLAYNLEGLKEKNPDLVDRVALQNGQDLHEVQVNLTPDQLILIPEINEPCYMRYPSIGGGEVRAAASCAFEDSEAHLDLIYAYNDPLHSMNHYTNEAENAALLEVLEGMRQSRETSETIAHEQAGDMIYTVAKRNAESQLVEPLKRESEGMQCLTDVSCFGLQDSLWSAAVYRQDWIDNNLLSYDISHDSWFSNKEYSKAITDCELAHPKPKK